MRLFTIIHGELLVPATHTCDWLIVPFLAPRVHTRLSCDAIFFRCSFSLSFSFPLHRNGFTTSADLEISTPRSLFLPSSSNYWNCVFPTCLRATYNTQWLLLAVSATLRDSLPSSPGPSPRPSAVKLQDRACCSTCPQHLLLILSSEIDLLHSN